MRTILTGTLSLSLLLLGCASDDGGDDDGTPSDYIPANGSWSLTFSGTSCGLAPQVELTLAIEEGDPFAVVHWADHDGYQTDSLTLSETWARVMLTQRSPANPDGSIVEQVDATFYDDGASPASADLTYRAIAKGSSELCTIGPIQPTVTRSR